MKNRRRILLMALGVALVGGVSWVMLASRDPLFRGKPESQWMTNIAYGMQLSEDQNKAQVQRWKDFGPEGLAVLGRGLAANRSPTYQKLYGRLDSLLPRFLVRFLPAPPPKTVGGTRYCVVDLLCRMGESARPAWRSVARALADEDPLVRSRAISFFDNRDNDESFLNQMPPGEKAQLLSMLLSAVEDRGWCWNVRNNAAGALRFFPEQAPRIVPSLIKVLPDSSPYVQLSAASALNRLDPVAGSKAGAVTVVAKILQNPDYQLSGTAAFALRQFQYDGDAAVTALIEVLHGTNSSVVGSSAVWSLQHAFPNHADRIIPELRKATNRTDSVGGYARGALSMLESDAKRKRP